MGEIFGGRYELVDPIGAGGAGSVWRVWDWKRSQYRAAKVMKQSDSVGLLRFIRETGTRIEHPHVLAPTSWVGEDDRVMFTMDLVAGGSLATLIGDHGRLPDWFAMIVIDQLLSALATVHASGLIHRDLKPGNLLLEATGSGMPQVRLADFGIAAGTEDPRLTHTTEVVGTPGYMSTLARMGVDPEPAQDLYAVAMIFAEMLTGRRPIEGQPAYDLSDVACRTELVALIDQMAERSGHGFESADQARAALRQIRSHTKPAEEPVEVLNQIGPLPLEWGPEGPSGTPAPVAGGWAPGTPVTAGQGGLTVEAAGVAPTAAVAVGGRRMPGSVWILTGAGLLCLIVALLLAMF